MFRLQMINGHWATSGCKRLLSWVTISNKSKFTQGNDRIVAIPIISSITHYRNIYSM